MSDVAGTILSHAADSAADLIVMGGYGHSRLREFILGGATDGMLRVDDGANADGALTQQYLSHVTHLPPTIGVPQRRTENDVRPSLKTHPARSRAIEGASEWIIILRLRVPGPARPRWPYRRRRLEGTSRSMQPSAAFGTARRTRPDALHTRRVEATERRGCSTTIDNRLDDDEAGYRFGTHASSRANTSPSAIRTAPIPLGSLPSRMPSSAGIEVKAAA